MRINTSFIDFKKKHFKKIHQILFRSVSCKDYHRVENLYKFLLAEKNSFIFESVEKGVIRGRYTIIGLNPDKIWDINNNIVTLNTNGKKIKLKTNPLRYLNRLLKDFKIKTPAKLPSMASMLVGYFSYDIIRYIEKIPDRCKDDLKIPDVRLSRPRNLVIYDNLKKKIYYIENVYTDTKIKDYNETYNEIIKKFELYESFENIKLPNQFTFKPNKNDIKSNTSKNKFKFLVRKAKSYIKKGDIFQVVLSQRFERKINKRPIEIYNFLRKSNPSPFMFYFNYKDFNVLGSSPEILVRLRKGEVTVRPIAGTRPRGRTIKEDKNYVSDLLKDKKELADSTPFVPPFLGPDPYDMIAYSGSFLSEDPFMDPIVESFLANEELSLTALPDQLDMASLMQDFAELDLYNNFEYPEFNAFELPGPFIDNPSKSFLSEVTIDSNVKCVQVGVEGELLLEHGCLWEVKSQNFTTKVDGVKYKTIKVHIHPPNSYNNDSKYACKYADLVTQSYHPVKAITTAEGGSVLTNNKSLHEKIFKRLDTTII